MGVKKEIECWVYTEHDLSGEKNITVTPEKTSMANQIKATLTIHDYPEQKLELTASQIEDAMIAEGMGGAPFKDLTKRLGFTQQD